MRAPVGQSIGPWFLPQRLRPPLPEPAWKEWPHNAVDRFVLARLHEQNLTPAPLASKETLIRRVTLSLTGLPPTMREVDEFLADHQPDAYERVVAQLLKSPRYWRANGQLVARRSEIRRHERLSKRWPP